MRTIGFIAFPGVTALDLAGPLEALHAANQAGGNGQPYRTIVLSPCGGKVRSESGLTISTDASLARAPRLDTIVVPGGAGLRVPRMLAPIAAWLRARALGTRRIVSVCTGIYALAEAGLLDGKRATTHWRFATDVHQRYPGIRIDADAIYVRDGKIYTSAGISAGIDLTLALIEEDLGERLALSVARELVLYMKRGGGQLQFSEPLQFQSQAVDRFSELATWIVANLRADLSVEALAGRAGISPRQLSRRFSAAVGASPAAFVERLRLDEARRRLLAQRQTIDRVSSSVGYASADAFRRAFERRFGVAPRTFRKRFSTR